MNENSAEKNLQFNLKKCKYLSVGNNKETAPSHTLEVDSWNITYDNDNNINETEDGKKNMEEVTELKYLGFVILCNAMKIRINHQAQ